MTTRQKRRAWRPRVLVALAVTALLPAAVLAIVPVSYPPPVLVPVDINVSAGDQFDPHVSGDWVSYTSDISIRYYNFSTNIDAAIPMGSSVNDLLAGISGSKIAFSRVTLSSGTQIMVFDAATPAIAPVEIDPVPNPNRFGVAIGGNTVAYIDFGLQGNGELVIHDLTTSTSVRITNDTVGDGNPSVSPNGDVVVWEHCATSLTNCDVWQAVKTSGVWNVTVASGSANPEGNPHTNGTLVVYDSHRGGTENIFWHPVTGGAEGQLEMAGFQGDPHIAGDIVAFEGRPTVVDAADIFVYDIVNNRLFQITNTPGVNEQLNDITVLPDGSVRVVWASDEDGADQRNIKGATFRLPNIAPTLAASTESGYGIDGVSPDLGSTSTAFTYKIVYADFDNQVPAYLHVCIDGTCHAMLVDSTAAASLQDGNYKNGEQYSYTTTLPLGTHDYFFEASDGTATVRFPASGVVSGPAVSNLVITTATLPDGMVGSPYSVTLTASGGTLPYNWDTGPLPPGLTMDFSTGVISGTPTTIGTYVLSIFVADAVGGFDSKNLTLVVNPIPTPPTIHVPGTITVSATSRGGAAVTYVVTATDVVDPNPTVTCLPASGSTFSIGTTTVICVATNASGLSSRATFDVIVKGAADQVVDLIALLKHFKIKIGIDNSLEAKLQNILAVLLAGGRNTANVCAQLDAFLNEVHAQTGKAINAGQAAQLIARTNQIKAVVGCP